MRRYRETASAWYWWCESACAVNPPPEPNSSEALSSFGLSKRSVVAPTAVTHGDVAGHDGDSVKLSRVRANADTVLALAGTRLVTDENSVQVPAGGGGGGGEGGSPLCQ